MDWIERLFHISPDGGSGLTEIAILSGIAALIAAAFVRVLSRPRRTGDRPGTRRVR